MIILNHLTYRKIKGAMVSAVGAVRKRAVRKRRYTD